MNQESYQRLAGIAMAFLRRVDLKGEESPAHNAAGQFLDSIATGALIVTPGEPSRLQPVETPPDGNQDSGIDSAAS